MNAQVQTTDIVATKTTTALAVVTASIAEINSFEQGVAELEKQYKGVVYDVRTRKGMDAAKEARAQVRKPRYALQKIEAAAKKPLNDLKDAIASQTAAMIGRISSIEDPIDEQIKNEEERLHNEAVERARKESERVATLDARLEAIRTMPYDANGMKSDDVRKVLDEARAMKIGDDWQEFADKARGALVATIASLEGVLAKSLAAEAEAARLAAERAELERLRAAEAERQRQAEAERKATLAKQEAELAEQRRLLEEQERQLREAREAEEARIAELQRQEDERIAIERAALQREQEEARQAQEEERRKIEKEREDVAAQAERIRNDHVNFRAHFARATPEQREELRAASDANPEADVFSLPFPAADKHEQGIAQPPFLEIVQVLAAHYNVDEFTVRLWVERITGFKE